MENSTEQSQKSKDVFLTMVGLLGLKSEVKDKVSGRNIILSVSTDEPGRLIGRNGSSLDNVGLLMNRILKKTDNTFPKVIIDVDGYDKKSKRDRRKNNNRKDRRQKSDRMEKTAVMTEAASDDQINVYVDHETDKLAPVTTVALDHSEKNDFNGKPQKRERRDNRRGNRRDNNRRNDRRRDDRRERAPQNKKEAAPATASNETSKPENAAPAPVAEKQAAAAAAPASNPAPVAEKQAAPADKGGKPVNKLQMQCRNAAKEVKRWGEDILLPPLSEGDCQKAIEYFGKEKEVSAQIDNSRSYGEKKRVRISLKK